MVGRNRKSNPIKRVLLDQYKPLPICCCYTLQELVFNCINSINSILAEVYLITVQNN